MAPQSLFEKAAAYVATPACDGATNDQKLELYGLFKQATKGDATGPRPGIFDAVKRAKYDAWADESGLPPDEARRRYIRLVCEISPAFTTAPPSPGAPTATATSSAAAAPAAAAPTSNALLGQRGSSAAGVGGAGGSSAPLQARRTEDSGLSLGAGSASAPSQPSSHQSTETSPSMTASRNEATTAAAAADSPAAFEAAVAHAATPACSDATNDQKLQLYGLFKQAKKGNASSWERPGMFDPVGRAKYDAWAKVNGMGPVTARAAYVALVQELDPKVSATVSTTASAAAANVHASADIASAELSGHASPSSAQSLNHPLQGTSTLRPRARPAPRAQSVKGLEIVRYSQAGFASASNSMDAILAAHGVKPEHSNKHNAHHHPGDSSSAHSSSNSLGSSSSAVDGVSEAATQQALIDSEVDWYGLPFAGGDLLNSARLARETAEPSSSPERSPSTNRRHRRRGGPRTKEKDDEDDDDENAARAPWPGIVAIVVAMDQWLWAAWADGGTTVALVALAAMAAGAIVHEHYSTAAAAVFASVYVALSVRNSSDGGNTSAEGATAAVARSGERKADSGQQNSNKSSTTNNNNNSHGNGSASMDGGGGNGEAGHDGKEGAFKPLKRRRSSLRGSSFNGSTHGNRSAPPPPFPPSPVTAIAPTSQISEAAENAGAVGNTESAAADVSTAEAGSVTKVGDATVANSNDNGNHTSASIESASIESASNGNHSNDNSNTSSSASGETNTTAATATETTGGATTTVVDAVESLRAFTGKWRKDLIKSGDQSAHMKAIGVPWIVRAAIARSPQVTEIETDGRTWIETTVNVGGRKVQTLQLDNSLQERRNPLDKTPVTMASALRADGAVVTESEYPALGLTQTLTRVVSGEQQEVYTVTNVMRLADGTELTARSHFDRLSDDDEDELAAGSAKDNTEMLNLN